MESDTEAIPLSNPLAEIFHSNEESQVRFKTTIVEYWKGGMSDKIFRNLLSTILVLGPTIMIIHWLLISESNIMNFILLVIAAFFGLWLSSASSAGSYGVFQRFLYSSMAKGSAAREALECLPRFEKYRLIIDEKSANELNNITPYQQEQLIAFITDDYSNYACWLADLTYYKKNNPMWKKKDRLFKDIENAIDKSKKTIIQDRLSELIGVGMSAIKISRLLPFYGNVINKKRRLLEQKKELPVWTDLSEENREFLICASIIDPNHAATVANFFDFKHVPFDDELRLVNARFSKPVPPPISFLFDLLLRFFFFIVSKWDWIYVPSPVARPKYELDSNTHRRIFSLRHTWLYFLSSVVIHLFLLIQFDFDFAEVLSQASRPTDVLIITLIMYLILVPGLLLLLPVTIALDLGAVQVDVGTRSIIPIGSYVKSLSRYIIGPSMLITFFFYFPSDLSIWDTIAYLGAICIFAIPLYIATRSSAPTAPHVIRRMDRYFCEKILEKKKSEQKIRAHEMYFDTQTFVWHVYSDLKPWWEEYVGGHRVHSGCSVIEEEVSQHSDTIVPHEEEKLPQSPPPLPTMPQPPPSLQQQVVEPEPTPTVEESEVVIPPEPTPTVEESEVVIPPEPTPTPTPMVIPNREPAQIRQSPSPPPASPASPAPPAAPLPPPPPSQESLPPAAPLPPPPPPQESLPPAAPPALPQTQPLPPPPPKPPEVVQPPIASDGMPPPPPPIGMTKMAPDPFAPKIVKEPSSYEVEAAPREDSISTDEAIDLLQDLSE